MTNQARHDLNEFSLPLTPNQRRVAMECLGQLYRQGPVEDGDLISKWYRTWLWKNGFVRRFEGFNTLTEKGRKAIEGGL